LVFVAYDGERIGDNRRVARWLADVGPLDETPFDAEWPDRTRHGVPGPIYAVASNAASEPTSNVACLASTGFVWRQPRTAEEIDDTIGRLANGWLILGEIGVDGDDHWTLDGIRAWWMLRAAHAAAYREAGIPDVARYFEVELHDYLRAYAFFLENARRAAEGEPLPDIDAPLSIVIPPPPPPMTTTGGTSALQLLADAPRLLTARGLVAGKLPFWGGPRGLDVPGLFSGGSSRIHGVCPAPQPFIYRQPGSSREFEQLIAVAVAEPYALGLQPLLSVGAVREWWAAKREPVREAMRVAKLPDVDAYIDEELADYLRGYLFFRMRKRVPRDGDVLPSLEEPPSFHERPMVFREPPKLPFTRGVIEGEPVFQGWFHERNPLNVPGMFYGAATDSCDTGPAEAPDNVALDPNAQEFVFRQPRDERELKRVFNACRVECFDGYGTDGNEHWTPALVRQWWAERATVREAWRVAGIADVDTMFADELPRYLRGYLFLLESGRVPNAADELPELER
jgi:hypothetical protein